MNTAYAPSQAIDDGTLRLQNLLSSKQVKMPVALGGHSGELEVLPERVQRDYNLALKVLVNQIPCCVMLDVTLMDWYLSRIEADVDFMSLPEELRQAIVLRGANELVESIAKQLSVSLSVQQVSFLNQLPANPCSCSAVLKLDDYSCALDLSFAQDVAYVLEKSLSSFPSNPAQVDANVPVGVAFEKGRTLLTYNQLQELELFDVILFDQVWQDVLVVVKSGWCIRASCQLVETGAAMAAGVPGELENAERLDQETAITGFQIIMEEVVEEPSAIELPEGLEGVPVTLTFELGRQEVPMGQVSSFDQGYTFSLQANAQAPIEVRANGQLIGLAELVQIGDNKLGARLVSLQGS